MAPFIALSGLFLLFAGLGVAGVHVFAEWFTCLRLALAGMFLLTASAHWGKRRPDLVRMVPRAFRRPELLVTLTGLLELLGAIGLLLRPLAPLAAAGLSLLLLDKFIALRGIDAPAEPRYVPEWEPSSEPRELDLAATGISVVIWSTGFRTDYSWIEVPIFDGRGYPVHKRGVTAAGGLYFLGLPWLYTWGSGRFSGVAADAEFLAGQIATHARPALPAGAAAPVNELALGS